MAASYSNIILIVKFYFGLYLFISKLFETTLTLLKAIAVPAIMGLNSQPVNGYKMPAANGI